MVRTMKSPSFPTIALTAIALLMPTLKSAYSQTVLDGISWYRVGGGTGSSLNVSSGSLVYTPASTAATVNIVGYFNPQTIALGQTITLSLNITMSQIPNAMEAVRFGLFNSGGSQVTANSNSFDNAAFAAYQGYSTWFNPAATSSAYSIRERIATNNNAIFAGGSSNNPSLGTVSNATIGLGANIPSTWALSLTRTEAGLSLLSTVNGIELSRVDNISPYFTFDTVAVQFSANVTGAVTFNSVTVPEPSAAILGILGAGFLLMRLRRSRR
ncbi:hypothetical protein TSACC_21003 [Terrimicrobium sacchariphilum]|uniref:PEP-CTERM protein-sorting domain-containing protein n=2 Tax=Terrimicrobium sacchariphilum TaxID=690879 RepID=A0A146G6N7_TERSA|nr:hypothetical protein TSACC_21003 [Terrimicrobium sacchariphilum]